MSRIVYVNGAYLPEEEAKICVFDRGFLFADGVYEVTSVLDGKLVDFPGHLAPPAPLARRARDAGAGRRRRASRRSTASSSRATASTEGMVYLQVTRGAADRDFAYPAEPGPEPRPLHPGAAARRHGLGRATASG